MVFFFILLVVPLLVAVAAFIFLDGITWKEFLAQVGAQAVVAGISVAICYHSNTGDTEVWNGRVASKRSDHVSCSHSYECHCRMETTTTGSGKNKTTTTTRKCDTCYEHSYDIDWTVRTTNGESIGIHRVDRQGLVEPSRWTDTVIGEPTSVPHSYTSYIKGSPDTLFRHQGQREKYKETVPVYPGQVYDYYRLNHFVNAGASVSDGKEWSGTLADLNADLGSAKQANILVVLTKQPRDWFYALEETWLGGKKNDIVLVVGTKEDMTPDWVEVMAWTTDQTFKVKLRDDVLDEGPITPKATMDALRRNITAYHKRKPMKDFEYLKASIVPSTTHLVVALIIGLIVAIGLTWLFQVHDVFGDEGGRVWRRKFI